MLENILQLTVDHQVGTAVLGALQRANGGCNGRVGIGARGGQHTGGKGGAVAAAVVGMDQQAHIQQLGFLVSKLLVRAVGAQDVLRGALAGLGHVEEHALLIIIAALHLVSVHHHGGHTGDQIDALVQDILQRQILGMLVVGIQAQHAPLHLVHNIGRRSIHGIHKAIGQGAVLCQQLTELVQLLLGGQAAEQQQPDDLFKHKAVVAVGLVHDLVDVHAAVDQTTRNGNDMPFLILFVAHNVTDIGQACQHTGAIRVAQAALDTETLTRLRVDVVVCQILFTQRPHGLRVQRRHFCMGIVHARISPFSYFFLIYFPAIHHDGTPL